MHHDAHEFLNYLLNRIVEEMEEAERLQLPSGDDRTPTPRFILLLYSHLS